MLMLSVSQTFTDDVLLIASLLTYPESIPFLMSSFPASFPAFPFAWSPNSDLKRFLLEFNNRVIISSSHVKFYISAIVIGFSISAT